VSLLAMFVSYVGVLLRLFVFAEIMMMGGLVMMMRRCVVLSGSLVMVLTGRMLWGLCHGAIPPNQHSKRMSWLWLGYGVTCYSRQGDARRLGEYLR
jgi:hypothetical protein